MKRCDDCRYWDSEEVNQLEIGYPAGECRRFPPVLNPVSYKRLCKTETLEVAIYLASQFPITHDSMSCGEWKAKEVAV